MMMVYLYSMMKIEKSLEKLSWETFEFAWDWNSLFQADRVSGIPSVIDNCMVRDSISKMKNRKAVEPSDVVSEMVKAAG